MHPDLSPHLHTDECNKLIEQYRACHTENKFLKFVGVCNDLDRAVWKCLKAERLERRAKNRLEGIERRKLIHARIRAGETWDRD